MNAAPRRLGHDRSDLVLLLAALLFGLATVFYPFGGDQGLYYYVGREWLHGSIPYRDAMEQKTPLIFLLHALLVALTGPNMWAIRVAELALVPLIGLALAELATPRGAARRPGVFGLASFSTSVLYFGLFGYWDTAQCEIWYVGFSLASLAVVARGASVRRTWSVAGLLGGLALVMKPPAAILLLAVVPVMVTVVRRDAPVGERLRRALVALSIYGAGAAVPIAATGLYFASEGALGHLVDLALRANYHDMVHSSTVSDLGDVLGKLLDFVTLAGPLVPGSFAIALLGLLASRRRTPRTSALRHGLALAMFVAGVAAVAVQRKFYGYHWGVLAPIMAFPLACWADDLGRPGASVPPWLRARVPIVLAAGLVAVFGAGSSTAGPYARTVRLTAEYLAGSVARSEFLAPFVLDDNTPYAQQEVVGRWIASHSLPDDLIAVRGFDQTVYALAHRRAPTRFFWTRWLTEPRRAYRRAEWLAEDREALRRRPPRYVVVSDRARKGPASRRYFERLGYAECFRHGRLIVLERREALTATLT